MKIIKYISECYKEYDALDVELLFKFKSLLVGILFSSVICVPLFLASAQFSLIITSFGNIIVHLTFVLWFYLIYLFMGRALNVYDNRVDPKRYLIGHIYFIIGISFILILFNIFDLWVIK